MSKVILYIAATLDGYIAGPDGDLSWLDAYQGQDFGYQAFYDGVGTLIMGAATYEWLLNLGGPWPHSDRMTYVFAHRALANVDPANIAFHSGSPAILVDTIKSAGDRNIWLVGGSKLVTTFMNAGLVDEVMLFVIPIFLGEGIPLFQNLRPGPALELLDTVNYPGGVVQLRYRVPKQKPAAE